LTATLPSIHLLRVSRSTGNRLKRNMTLTIIECSVHHDFISMDYEDDGCFTITKWYDLTEENCPRCKKGDGAEGSAGMPDSTADSSAAAGFLYELTPGPGCRITSPSPCEPRRQRKKPCRFRARNLPAVRTCLLAEGRTKQNGFFLANKRTAAWRCPICMEIPHQLALLRPYKHTGFCFPCTKRATKDNRACPYCMQQCRSVHMIIDVR